MPSNPYVGAARAVVGQGVGMGWGDEAEAWLRSKLPGSEGYSAELAKINNEYAQYSKEHPVMAPALEFTGGAAPALAAMLVTPSTGGAAAPVATSALSRLAANPYVRGAATGALTGGVSGAGAAQPGDRGAGATSGAVIGTVLGGAIPAVIRGGGTVAKWLRERIAPSDATETQAALGKISQAVTNAKLTPKQVGEKVLADRARGIPSTMANADPSLADLTEAIVRRSGPSARVVEKKLGEQVTGARERVHSRTSKDLGGGNYYADEEALIQGMRERARPAYDAAYGFGAVDDPIVNETLRNPKFQEFWKKARDIADTEALAARLRGEDPSKFALPEIYTPSGKFGANGDEILELTKFPDVRTLDYIKRGIDATIDAGYNSAKGMSAEEATGLKKLRNVYLDAIDNATGGENSLYRQARQSYAGDAEVLKAMRAGMNDFDKLNHEQVANAVGKMGDSEKDAFRTGVVRNLYGRIMNPTGNINTAREIIGSPEAQAKLQPLFDSPAKFDLFKSALERESQLFHQSNRILGGAAAGTRGQAGNIAEGGSGVGEAIGHAITGGPDRSLMSMAARVARSVSMTDDVAEKTAKLLMSSDPHEVAAAVKLIETYDAKMAAGASRLGKTEAATVMGSTAAFPPSPIDTSAKPADIDAEEVPNIPGGYLNGPDIEEAIAADKLKEEQAMGAGIDTLDQK